MTATTLTMTIRSWFISPQGEAGEQVTRFQNGGGWESAEAMKTDRLRHYRSRKDVTLDELPTGFRVIHPMRHADPRLQGCYAAQEVTIP